MVTRITTKTGDDGTTGLYGGDRVPKEHPRIEALGTIDEANSTIGVALSQMKGPAGVETLDWVQGRMLFCCAVLAAPQVEGQPPVFSFPEEDCSRLERECNALADALPDLTAFIHPGGPPPAAALHLARTVVRRAERRVVALSRVAPIDRNVKVFLNRLSDYLFQLARTYAQPG